MGACSPGSFFEQVARAHALEDRTGPHRHTARTEAAGEVVVLVGGHTPAAPGRQRRGCRRDHQAAVGAGGRPDRGVRGSRHERPDLDRLATEHAPDRRSAGTVRDGAPRSTWRLWTGYGRDDPGRGGGHGDPQGAVTGGSARAAAPRPQRRTAEIVPNWLIVSTSRRYTAQPRRNAVARQLPGTTRPRTARPCPAVAAGRGAREPRRTGRFPLASRGGPAPRAPPPGIGSVRRGRRRPG